VLPDLIAVERGDMKALDGQGLATSAIGGRRGVAIDCPPLSVRPIQQVLAQQYVQGLYELAHHAVAHDVDVIELAEDATDVGRGEPTHVCILVHVSAPSNLNAKSTLGRYDWTCEAEKAMVDVPQLRDW